MKQILESAFVALQYLLPRHWLTAVIYRVARIRNKRVKDVLITRFVKLYDVDTDEIKLELPGGFATFNDFFVRELNDNAREIDTDKHSIIAPADGTVSLAGSLCANSLLQAKGLEYTLDDLLATDLDESLAYVDGRFATIYLAPYNYHRVHAPFDAELVAARYVPGDLFSVNEATVSKVAGLFRRNERLVMHFKTASGPAVLILVGALNVGSISTPWSGEIRPRKAGSVDAIALSGHDTRVLKGDLLGWFNMGSTVILLLPDGGFEWHAALEPGQTLRMGQSIGTYTVAER
ncbi:MAG: phosphatidylserine decarboxylase [Gammaproteobacteria bacterium]|nr:phosphatidylserine decarboxylase [Gammaproteobacteria bacterium]MBU2676452.1 phosphatidylserine decarboxylase [Gammaproteobacteria bacterium]NNC57930.1 phosphatidylserine decarboxylase [Woeseiaceae bacterium]NNL50187.1 phosphatidylserine decarboxylase [Woeseiaceae bacterium]